MIQLDIHTIQILYIAVQILFLLGVFLLQCVTGSGCGEGFYLGASEEGLKVEPSMVEGFSSVLQSCHGKK